MSKGMKCESEKYRTTDKNKQRKEQLKEGVKKDRMGFRSNEKSKKNAT
jgi:hypothetical protein